MIERVDFKNFKALRETSLPLGRFTLLVGPNGSGKSSALQALRLLTSPGNMPLDRVSTSGSKPGCVSEVVVQWASPPGWQTAVQWDPSQGVRGPSHSPGMAGIQRHLSAWLQSICIYSLSAADAIRPVSLHPEMALGETGANLAGLLDRLRDRAPERFEALNAELSRWLPEFDRILFDTPQSGQRAFLLRTGTGHAIQAQDLSQGTVLALTILALAHLPDPPCLVGLEEPDRGIHPRLLREVRDAIYRLSHPEKFQESRKPVQVVVTTHSPYMLDLYRDHPEEVVIAQKIGPFATFERLIDRPDSEEILRDSHLGEAWYSGVLGGVPTHP